MVNSIVIICEDSPFGKNSTVESIRMGTGLLAIGDIDNCKVVFLQDAIYFLSKNLDPGVLDVKPFTNIMRLIELSGIEIYVHGDALEAAGMNESDLIPLDNIQVVDIKKISQLMLEADMNFKY